jgi:hypothetical protein
MSVTTEFWNEIDRLWPPSPAQTIRIIGSGALMLQTQYQRATNDSDVLEATDLDSTTRQRLVDIGGKDTALASKFSMYVDIVNSGIPFLPHPARCTPTPT